VCKYVFNRMHLYVCWKHLYVSGKVLSRFVCNFVTNSLQTLDTKMKYTSYILIIYMYAFICILAYTLVHSYESGQVIRTYIQMHPIESVAHSTERVVSLLNTADGLWIQKLNVKLYFYVCVCIYIYTYMYTRV